MDIYKKIDATIRKFRKVYPRELAAQLPWWEEVLGLDRVKLLRLIGLSASQAARRKDEDLELILENPEWKTRAVEIESMLCNLLPYFHHDWNVLAESIRNSAAQWREAPSPNGNGMVREVSNEATSEQLLQRLAAGGPDWMSLLMGYLITAQADS
jgi:hypothetical protein